MNSNYTMIRPKAISSTNAVNNEKRFFVEAEPWILERAKSDKPTTYNDVKLRFKHKSHLSDKRINAVLRKILAKRRELAIITGITPKGVQTTANDGYIYMVENLAYPGWIKAGMTTNVSSRLDSSDPFRSFVIIASRKVIDRRHAESWLLNDLKMKSELYKNEWFKISKEVALKIFESII